MIERYPKAATRRTARHAAWLCALTLVAAGLCSCGKKPVPAPQPAAGQAAAPAAQPAANAEQHEEPYVVEVNGRRLLRRHLDQLVAEKLAERGMTDIPPGLEAQLRGEAADTITEVFIRQTVLEDEATRQKIEIGAEEVELAIADLKESVPDGGSYEEELRRRNSSDEQARAELAAHPRMKILKLLRLNAEPVADPTEEDVATAYQANLPRLTSPERLRIRHLMVACAPNAPPATVSAARRRAEELRQQLADGADFASLAREHSEGPSKEFGGELGPFARGELDAVLGQSFDAVVFAQEEEIVGPIFRTETGFHIVAVLERLAASAPPLEAVRKDLAQVLLEQRQSAAYERYYQALRAQATIHRPEPATP